MREGLGSRLTLKMMHSYNPNYSGGESRRSSSSRPAWETLTRPNLCTDATQNTGAESGATCFIIPQPSNPGVLQGHHPLNILTFQKDEERVSNKEVIRCLAGSFLCRSQCTCGLSPWRKRDEGIHLDKSSRRHRKLYYSG